ncbi:serine/arginine repetitive matrix protein 1-like [Ananas comosus]|uniref:Serine/arginine repetitive matrix protein 1-like n=1 Tax=Ananas comosus TaxID=4615 RepID=A0A6P5H4Q3_ANACO|nr:serine/arginine repetitive matrix protein 1-like [Ananas comosus]
MVPPLHHYEEPGQPEQRALLPRPSSTCASSGRRPTEGREAVLAAPANLEARLTQTSPARPLDPRRRRPPRAPALCGCRAAPELRGRARHRGRHRRGRASAAAAAGATPRPHPPRRDRRGLVRRPPPRRCRRARDPPGCGSTPQASSPSSPSQHQRLLPPPPPHAGRAFFALATIVPRLRRPASRVAEGADAADNPAHRVAATADGDRGGSASGRSRGHGWRGGFWEKSRTWSKARRRGPVIQGAVGIFTAAAPPPAPASHGFTAAAPELHPRLRSAGRVHQEAAAARPRARSPPLRAPACVHHYTITKKKKPSEIATAADAARAERRAARVTAALDRRDVPGCDTPLHLAARLPRAPTLAAALAVAGADPSLQNAAGWTLLGEAGRY